MTHPLRVLVPVVALLAFVTGSACAADAPTGKWRIQFQGHAVSDGEVHLRVTPQTGEPVVIALKVSRGRGEMGMANDLVAAFKAQLPKLRFKSEVVHNNEVLLKAGHEEPVFGVEFVDSSVEGSKVILGPA
jgi:hypothetical protein